MFICPTEHDSLIHISIYKYFVDMFIYHNFFYVEIAFFEEHMHSRVGR